MRHTKIVATIGPASSAADVLRALLLAGVDVCRLNFSHGTHESHAAVYRTIRDTARALGRVVGVMQDLSGPKIRTGPLADDRPLELHAGDTLRVAAGDGRGGPGRIYTTYAPLVESVGPGDRLLIDDGRIELLVERAEQGEIVTKVVHGGTLAARKGINAPGVRLPASAVTGKDERDLIFGLELGVDAVALSFVQTAGDVERARQIMRRAGREVPLIAKIERPAGVDHIESILEAADGVMVARGDLGLEMPLEQVPRVQRHLIQRSRAAGRPVILATQVLESMRSEPRPTRAEVSDAANAVHEGADAIMLAGETAAGAFPVRAVETLDAVIRDAELMLPMEGVRREPDAGASRHAVALCEAAVTLASTARADAIIAVTREGNTARLLASLRPAAPVIAVTVSPEVAAACTLLWGVTPVLMTTEMPVPVAGGEQMGELERLLVERELLRAGAVAVFVNVSTALNRTDANFVNVQRLG